MIRVLIFLNGIRDISYELAYTNEIFSIYLEICICICIYMVLLVDININNVQANR